MSIYQCLFVGLFLVAPMAFGQPRESMEITSNTVIHFVLTDPGGRKVGWDPRRAVGVTTFKEWEEIPDLNYSTNAIGDAPENDTPMPEDVQHELAGTLEQSELNGLFRVECIGLANGKYRLNVTVSFRNSRNVAWGKSTVIGFCEKDSAILYCFDYRAASGVFVPLTKQVTFSILRNDINTAFSLQLLGDEKLRDKLLSYVDKCEKTLGKKEDSVKVAAELSQLSKDLSKEREETIKHEERKQKDKRFIGKDAFEILSEDVRMLLARFPKEK